MELAEGRGWGVSYIVIYDDGMGISMAYGWDDECEGALAYMHDGHAALFATKPEARKAIAISRAWERVRQLQGKPRNYDWAPACAGNIKIVEARAKGGSK